MDISAYFNPHRHNHIHLCHIYCGKSFKIVTVLIDYKTFIIPLMKDDYSFDQSITNVDESASTLLLTMKRVTVASNILIKKISYGNINEMPPDELKGWILFGFIHVLLCFMLTGFIRTVITDPGRVPNV